MAKTSSIEKNKRRRKMAKKFASRRAKLKTIKSLGLDDTIDDILITLSSQYHIIRPLRSTPEVFLYLVLDSSRANLAMARHQMRRIENELEV